MYGIENGTKYLIRFESFVRAYEKRKVSWMEWNKSGLCSAIFAQIQPRPSKNRHLKLTIVKLALINNVYAHS